MKKLVIGWITALAVSLACMGTVFAKPAALIPVGSTVGIKLYSQGLVVTGFDRRSPAKSAGMKKGDVILAADGVTVHSAEDLRSCLTGEQVVLQVLRKGREGAFCVKPEDCRLGAYVRDSIAGIGTVTWYDQATGAFGALGHGVSDGDTELLLPLKSGVVVPSSVTEVVKGKDGEPGELKGSFDVERIVGSVEKNTEKGIFGQMDAAFSGDPLPVAEAWQIEPGPAVIRSNVEGTEVQEYSVEILKCYPQAQENGRDMVLQITDHRLLEHTGGIVQGMSGSPIIQNGRIIGAVTHVLVNDSTTGYGIFIENMLDAAG